MRSRPPASTGMASAWIGVGSSYPRAATALTMVAARPRESNFVGGGEVVTSQSIKTTPGMDSRNPFPESSGLLHEPGQQTADSTREQAKRRRRDEDAHDARDDVETDGAEAACDAGRGP